MIRPEKLLTLCGLSLLAATFAFSLWKIGTRAAADNDPSVRVIRIAHWQLEDGVSDAIDAAARDYERLHPDVRIQQMRIPERVYPNWVTTQLVGGIAPDLVQIGKGIDAERLVRYFRPITDDVMLPNPYNRGTTFETTPWRDTYLDGMVSGFDEAQQDYYGAPLFMATVRMYANVTLLHQITGATELPRSLDELLALCSQAEAYAQQSGRPLMPIAGSRYNAPFLIERLFRSVTQRLNLELSTNRQLTTDSEHLMAALLQGTWDLDTPSIRAGLTLAGDVGRQMQPGFLQLAREDATFLFQQNRALFIATGSWDATTLINSSPFEIRVFDLPIPHPTHPAYGKHLLGRHSEASLRSYGPFGVSRVSAHPDIALDFMRFITSIAQNQHFADRSGWLPVIDGVRPRENIAAFAPVVDGYPDGFYLALGPDMTRVVNSQLHQLIAQGGSVERFVSESAAPLRAAARSDLSRALRSRTVQIARADLSLAAEEILAGSDPQAGENRRAQGQRERQFASEIQLAHLSPALAP